MIKYCVSKLDREKTPQDEMEDTEERDRGQRVRERERQTDRQTDRQRGTKGGDKDRGHSYEHGSFQQMHC